MTAGLVFALAITLIIAILESHTAAAARRAEAAAHAAEKIQIGLKMRQSWRVAAMTDFLRSLWKGDLPALAVESDNLSRLLFSRPDSPGSFNWFDNPTDPEAYPISRIELHPLAVRMKESLATEMRFLVLRVHGPLGAQVFVDDAILKNLDAMPGIAQVVAEDLCHMVAEAYREKEYGDGD